MGGNLFKKKKKKIGHTKCCLCNKRIKKKVFPVGDETHSSWHQVTWSEADHLYWSWPQNKQPLPEEKARAHVCPPVTPSSRRLAGWTLSQGPDFHNLLFVCVCLTQGWRRRGESGRRRLSCFFWDSFHAPFKQGPHQDWGEMLTEFL